MKENRAFKYMTKAKAFFPKPKMKLGVPLAFRAFNEYMNRMETLDDSLSDRKCPFSISLTEYKNNKSPLCGREKVENDRVINDLRKDIYVHEAVAIMNDLIQSTPRKEEQQ